MQSTASVSNTTLPVYREIAPEPRRHAVDLPQVALARAEAALLAKQHADGYWVGELQGDSILESEYILLRWILGQENEPELPLINNYLRSLQNADGGWSLFPGGPADLSGTVKAYFALKLMGDDAQGSMPWPGSLLPRRYSRITDTSSRATKARMNPKASLPPFCWIQGRNWTK